MAAFKLPPAYGFVAANVVGTHWLHHVYMGYRVNKAREQYGVNYPILYATEADLKDEKARNQYNCIQRAHQYCLENVPAFLGLLLVAGLRYPLTASVGAAIYLVGRTLYFNGYATGDPEKRRQGAILYIGLLILGGAASKMAFDGISAYRF